MPDLAYMEASTDLSAIAAGLFASDASAIALLQGQLLQAQSESAMAREREADALARLCSSDGEVGRLRSAASRAVSLEAEIDRLRMAVVALEASLQESEKGRRKSEGTCSALSGELNVTRDKTAVITAREVAALEGLHTASWENSFQKSCMEARLEAAQLEAEMACRKRLLGLEERLGATESQAQHWQAVACERATSNMEMEAARETSWRAFLNRIFNTDLNMVKQKVLYSWADAVFRKEQQELWDMHIFYLRKQSEEQTDREMTLCARYGMIVDGMLNSGIGRFERLILDGFFRCWACGVQRLQRSRAEEALQSVGRTVRDARVNACARAIDRFGRSTDSRFLRLDEAFFVWRALRERALAIVEQEGMRLRNRRGSDRLLHGISQIVATADDKALADKVLSAWVGLARPIMMQRSIRAQHGAKYVLLLSQLEGEELEAMLLTTLVQWHQVVTEVQQLRLAQEFKKGMNRRGSQVQQLMHVIVKDEVCVVLKTVFSAWCVLRGEERLQRESAMLRSQVGRSNNRRRLGFERCVFAWGIDLALGLKILVLRAWQQLAEQTVHEALQACAGEMQAEALKQLKAALVAKIKKTVIGNIADLRHADLLYAFSGWRESTRHRNRGFVIQGLTSNIERLERRHGGAVARLLLRAELGEDFAAVQRCWRAWALRTEDGRWERRDADQRMRHECFIESTLICWEWSEGIVLTRLVHDHWKFFVGRKRSHATAVSVGDQAAEALDFHDRLSEHLRMRCEGILCGSELLRDALAAKAVVQAWFTVVVDARLGETSDLSAANDYLRRLLRWSVTSLLIRISAHKDSLGVQACLASWRNLVAGSDRLRRGLLVAEERHSIVTDGALLFWSESSDRALLHLLVCAWSRETWLLRAQRRQAQHDAKLIFVSASLLDQVSASFAWAAFRLWDEAIWGERTWKSARDRHQATQSTAQRLLMSLLAASSLETQAAVWSAWKQLQEEAVWSARRSADMNRLQKTREKHGNALQVSLKVFSDGDNELLSHLVLHEWLRCVKEVASAEGHRRAEKRREIHKSKHESQVSGMAESWFCERRDHEACACFIRWRRYVETLAQRVAISAADAEVQRLRQKHQGEVRRVLLGLLDASAMSMQHRCWIDWRDAVADMKMESVARLQREDKGHLQARSGLMLEQALLGWTRRNSKTFQKLLFDDWMRVTLEERDLRREVADLDRKERLVGLHKAQFDRSLGLWSGLDSPAGIRCIFDQWHRATQEGQRQEAMRTLAAQAEKTKARHKNDLFRILGMMVDLDSRGALVEVVALWQGVHRDARDRVAAASYSTSLSGLARKRECIAVGALQLMDDQDAVLRCGAVLRCWTDAVAQSRDMMRLAAHRELGSDLTEHWAGHTAIILNGWQSEQSGAGLLAVFLFWKGEVGDSRRRQAVITMQDEGCRLRRAHYDGIAAMLGRNFGQQDEARLVVCLAGWQDVQRIEGTQRETVNKKARLTLQRVRVCDALGAAHGRAAQLLQQSLLNAWRGAASSDVQEDRCASHLLRIGLLTDQREALMGAMALRRNEEQGRVDTLLYFVSWRGHARLCSHRAEHGSLVARVELLKSIGGRKNASVSRIVVASDARASYCLVFPAWRQAWETERWHRQNGAFKGRLASGEHRRKVVLENAVGRWGDDQASVLLSCVLHRWALTALGDRMTRSHDAVLDQLHGSRLEHKQRLKNALLERHLSDLLTSTRFCYDLWTNDVFHARQSRYSSQTHDIVNSLRLRYRERVRRLVSALLGAEASLFLRVVLADWHAEASTTRRRAEARDMREYRCRRAEFLVALSEDSDCNLALHVYLGAWWGVWHRQRRQDAEVLVETEHARHLQIRDTRTCRMLLRLSKADGALWSREIISVWAAVALESRMVSNIDKTCELRSRLHARCSGLAIRMVALNSSFSLSAYLAEWSHVAKEQLELAKVEGEGQRVISSLHDRYAMAVNKTLMCWSQSDSRLLVRQVLHALLSVLQRSQTEHAKEAMREAHRRLDKSSDMRTAGFIRIWRAEQQLSSALVLFQSWAAFATDAMQERFVSATDERMVRYQRICQSSVRGMVQRVALGEDSSRLRYVFSAWCHAAENSQLDRSIDVQVKDIVETHKKRDSIVAGVMLRLELDHVTGFMQILYHCWSHFAQAATFDLRFAALDGRRGEQMGNMALKCFSVRLLVVFHAWMGAVRTERLTISSNVFAKKARIHATNVVRIMGWKADQNDASTAEIVFERWRAAIADMTLKRHVDARSKQLGRLQVRRECVVDHALAMLAGHDAGAWLHAVFQGWLVQAARGASEAREVLEMTSRRELAERYAFRVIKGIERWRRQFLFQIIVDLYRAWMYYVLHLNWNRRVGDASEAMARWRSKHQADVRRLMLELGNVDWAAKVWGAFATWADLTSFKKNESKAAVETEMLLKRCQHRRNILVDTALGHWAHHEENVKLHTLVHAWRLEATNARSSALTSVDDMERLRRKERHSKQLEGLALACFHQWISGVAAVFFHSWKTEIRCSKPMAQHDALQDRLRRLSALFSKGTSRWWQEYCHSLLKHVIVQWCAVSHHCRESRGSLAAVNRQMKEIARSDHVASMTIMHWDVSQRDVQAHLVLREWRRITLELRSDVQLEAQQSMIEAVRERCLAQATNVVLSHAKDGGRCQLHFLFLLWIRDRDRSRTEATRSSSTNRLAAFRQLHLAEACRSFEWQQQAKVSLTWVMAHWRELMSHSESMRKTCEFSNELRRERCKHDRVVSLAVVQWTSHEDSRNFRSILKEWRLVATLSRKCLVVGAAGQRWMTESAVGVLQSLWFCWLSFADASRHVEARRSETSAIDSLERRSRTLMGAMATWETGDRQWHLHALLCEWLQETRAAILGRLRINSGLQHISHVEKRHKQLAHTLWYWCVEDEANRIMVLLHAWRTRSVDQRMEATAHRHNLELMDLSEGRTNYHNLLKSMTMKLSCSVIQHQEWVVYTYMLGVWQLEVESEKLRKQVSREHALYRLVKMRIADSVESALCLGAVCDVTVPALWEAFFAWFRETLRNALQDAKIESSFRSVSKNFVEQPETVWQVLFVKVWKYAVILSRSEAEVQRLSDEAAWLSDDGERLRCRQIAVCRLLVDGKSEFSQVALAEIVVHSWRREALLGRMHTTEIRTQIMVEQTAALWMVSDLTGEAAFLLTLWHRLVHEAAQVKLTARKFQEEAENKRARRNERCMLLARNFAIEWSCGVLSFIIRSWKVLSDQKKREAAENLLKHGAFRVKAHFRNGVERVVNELFASHGSRIVAGLLFEWKAFAHEMCESRRLQAQEQLDDENRRCIRLYESEARRMAKECRRRRKSLDNICGHLGRSSAFTSCMMTLMAWAVQVWHCRVSQEHDGQTRDLRANSLVLVTALQCFTERCRLGWWLESFAVTLIAVWASETVGSRLGRLEAMRREDLKHLRKSSKLELKECMHGYLDQGLLQTVLGEWRCLASQSRLEFRLAEAQRGLQRVAAEREGQGREVVEASRLQQEAASDLEAMKARFLEATAQRELLSAQVTDATRRLTNTKQRTSHFLEGINRWARASFFARERQRLISAWFRASRASQQQSREEAHALAKRALSQAHSQRLDERERELEEWRKQTELWANALRQRHELGIATLMEECERQELDRTVRSSLHAWRNATLQESRGAMQGRLELAADRAERLERERLAREAGLARAREAAELAGTIASDAEAQKTHLAAELAETRRAASALEGKLRKHLAHSLDSRRGGHDAQAAAGLNGRAAHELFIRLIQVVYGDLETAWLSVGARPQGGRLAKEQFHHLATRIALGEASAGSVWSWLSSACDEEGTIRFTDFVNGPSSVAGSVPSHLAQAHPDAQVALAGGMGVSDLDGSMQSQASRATGASGGASVNSSTGGRGSGGRRSMMGNSSPLAIGAGGEGQRRSTAAPSASVW